MVARSSLPVMADEPDSRQIKFRTVDCMRGLSEMTIIRVSILWFGW